MARVEIYIMYMVNLDVCTKAFIRLIVMYNYEFCTVLDPIRLRI